MDFQIGEKVVYPNHGVGIIEQIDCRRTDGSSLGCYHLKIYSNCLRVMIPFANVRTVGLRRVVKRKEISQILHYLTDQECTPPQDWKSRFKENCEKMRTGSLLHVAEVYKGLLLVSQVKLLSFRERKMLDRARYLLISELAIVKNASESEIETLLEKTLAKARHNLQISSTTSGCVAAASQTTTEK